jgi:CDP-paratose 2-epimerase
MRHGMALQEERLRSNTIPGSGKFLETPSLAAHLIVGEMNPMGKKSVLVTGSCGLIGSDVCQHFYEAGYSVIGVDNNQRAVFFGPEGDTSWVLERLRRTIRGYVHEEIDIRHRRCILQLIEKTRPAVIVHTASQPSHDRAAHIPFDDFDTNAGGTLNLLEAARRYVPESPFIHMSTNKVYGDRPNTLKLAEGESRWDYADPEYRLGIGENFPIDQSLHSLFGASKVASDIMVQEYGRYFGMPTCALRCGCLTGPNHSGVELHGFLSYLVRCNLAGKEYKVFGYKGKQVRDNLHSEDVAKFMLAFVEGPRCGEVYNLGGGRENSCSVLEAFALAAEVSGQEQQWTYVDTARSGDHICYYSDLTKVRAHYPKWDITKDLRQTVKEIASSWSLRLASGS